MILLKYLVRHRQKAVLTMILGFISSEKQQQKNYLSLPEKNY